MVRETDGGREGGRCWRVVLAYGGVAMTNSRARPDGSGRAICGLVDAAKGVQLRLKSSLKPRRRGREVRRQRSQPANPGMQHGGPAEQRK